MRGRRKKVRGFTLIELIVVITIIGILAGAVVVYYPRWVEKARVTRAKSDIEAIKNAVNMFQFDTGRYPESLEELVNPPADAQGTRPAPYLEKMPIDPWNHPYIYTIEGNRPVIVSAGPDGQQGTEDDLSNVQQAADLSRDL